MLPWGELLVSVTVTEISAQFLVIVNRLFSRRKKYFPHYDTPAYLVINLFFL